MWFTSYALALEISSRALWLVRRNASSTEGSSVAAGRTFRGAFARVPAKGPITLTPASMNSIHPGSVITIGSVFGTVARTTSASFDAVFPVSVVPDAYAVAVYRTNSNNRFIGSSSWRNGRYAFVGGQASNDTLIRGGKWGEVLNCSGCQAISLDSNNSSVIGAFIFDTVAGRTSAGIAFGADPGLNIGYRIASTFAGRWRSGKDVQMNGTLAENCSFRGSVLPMGIQQ